MQEQAAMNDCAGDGNATELPGNRAQEVRESDRQDAPWVIMPLPVRRTEESDGLGDI